MNINEAFQILKNQLSNWLYDLIRLLPNILLSSVILVIGIYLSKKLSKWSVKLFKRFSDNEAINNLFGSITYIFLVGIVLFTVLSILNLDKAVTSILAGAGIIGLALAFAFQDIAANFISGIFITFRKPFHIGDIVKIQNYMGKVDHINLRDTVLLTFQGEMVIIPNKDVFQNPIENFTLLGKRRVDLSVGVSYGADLEQVRTVTLAAVQHIEHLSEDEEVTLFYREFGDSSINFLIRMWIKSPEQIDYLKACSEAIISIKKAYDANNISIPFPIRTLDFAGKGEMSFKEFKPK